MELARQRNLRQFKEKDKKEGNERAARMQGEVGYIQCSPHTTILYCTHCKLSDCRINKLKNTPDRLRRVKLGSQVPFTVGCDETGTCKEGSSGVTEQY